MLLVREPRAHVGRLRIACSEYIVAKRLGRIPTSDPRDRAEMIVVQVEKLLDTIVSNLELGHGALGTPHVEDMADEAILVAIVLFVEAPERHSLRRGEDLGD